MAQLKTSYAILILKDSQRKELYTIKLNLYDLARGPIHHNYIIDNKSTDTKGRLIFDFKMVQRVRLIIKALYLHTLLNDTLKEKAYNYSLKIIVFILYLT